MSIEEINELPRIRIRWRDFNPYQPIKIVITDWLSLRRFYNYMVVDSMFEYNGRLIELCVPYYCFIGKLRGRRVEEQKLVIHNRAVIELMKTDYHDRRGMVINSIELYWDKKD